MADQGKPAKPAPEGTSHLEFAVHTAPLPTGGYEITVFGELDHHTSGQLRELLDAAIADAGDVVVDMRACSFVDSSGLAALAGAAVRLAEQERHLHIRGVGDRVLRTFEIAGLMQEESMTVEPRSS